MVDPTVRLERRRHRAPRVVALALAGALLCAAPAFAAPGNDAGDVVVARGDGSTEPLREGGSTTQFTLRLPEGASCPGDSANDGFRVQSFLVPAAADPAMLRYKSTKPDGPGHYALYDVFTRPYVQGFTAEADGPGQPGLIVNLPTFSYAVFPPGELAEGPYRIGIACTLMNETIRFWDTRVTLMRAPDDAPAEIRWKVSGSGVAAGGTSSVGSVSLLAVAAIASAIAVPVVIARRRRQSRRVPISTEDS